jgi:hypothetical protein
MNNENLTPMAIQATLHCLTGCAIGEIAGTAIGSGLGWNNMATVLLAIVLAFFFGYSLTLRPLFKHGMGFRAAMPIAFASDTLSIVTMEIVDNAVMLLIPSALSAGPTTLLFWGSLAVSLVIAFAVTVPVNRYLIARGKGHAVMHSMHHH